MDRQEWGTAGLLLLVSAIGAACSDGSTGEPDAGPMARFSPAAEGPLQWDAVPFPHDLFLDDTGSVELATVPGDGAMWEDVRERLGERNGFCRSCPIHFPVRGPIDRTVLPSRPGPGDEASVSDSVLLVDVDPASPERGRLFPVETEWNDGTEIVSIRLRHGIALHPGRTYAGVLTSRVSPVCRRCAARLPSSPQPEE